MFYFKHYVLFYFIMRYFTALFYIYIMHFIFQIMLYFTFAFKVSNNPGAFIYDSLLHIYALTKLLLYIKLTDNLHISEYRRTYHQIQ